MMVAELGQPAAIATSFQTATAIEDLRIAAESIREIARAKAESFVLGDPYDARTTLGPVKNAAQRDRIRGYIRSGVDDGMDLVTGGPEAPARRSSAPWPPSSPTTARTRRWRSPTTPTTVWPPRCGRRTRTMPTTWHDVARRVRAGRIRINGSPINPRAPHGGFRLSGIGREFGRYGVEEFTEYQSIG